jgi:hypothetical protein|tara:strand:+ start:64 stop:519 length:456 start_codon:yes stop_codon:yes gene_type:complete
MNKLPIKDILAAIDMGALGVWDELSDEERKQISFYLLNRYVSSVKSNRDAQELAVFKTNEYYNKHFFTLQKHKKLLWQLLCLSGNTKDIMYHEWIGYKKKTGDNSKVTKYLMKMFPNMKTDEVELLARISTKKEIFALAADYGIDKKDVNI